MFREFKVGELFDINDTIKFNPRNNHLPAGDVPYITRTSKNNGQFDSYSDDSGQFTNKGNCITCGIEGAVAFYQPNDFIAGINVYTLRHERMTQRIGLYLCSVLNMQSWKYGFVNGRTLGRIKAETIQLPVKPGTDEVDYTEDDIDWAYMESYIQELEESYIQELDAYLKETGLDDYTLTDDEREVLEREPVFKEFEVGELFDKLNLKRIKPTFDKRSDLSKVQTEEFDLPLVNAKAGSNGIMYYGRSGDWESDTMTIDIVSNGAVSTGMVYTQPHATGVLWDAYLIKLKSDILSDVTVEHLLFLATTIQKSIQLKFNYSNKAVWAKVQNETIQLPVKPGTDELNYTEDDIDWDYMTSYARVMEKQVIADVVDYKNEMIATTKGLIKN
jgi:hypothetical protein